MLHMSIHPASHPKQKLSLALLAAIICAIGLVLVASPAWSQSSSGTAEPSVTQRPASPNSPAAAVDPAKVVPADSRMITDLAQGSMAEIEAGKLALQKSKNDNVKKFAQEMIDEHTKALGEVQALAQTKDVTLPDGPGIANKTVATALKVLSGDTFDKQYAKRAGVGNHESTVKLLQKIEKDAKDPDLKALASKMLPNVEHHLETAKQLVAAK